jgi:hypothetical protein
MNHHDAKWSRRRMMGASLGAVGGACCTGALGTLGAKNAAMAQFADPPEEGPWTELFDGKSLEGWHTNPKKIGHGTGGLWTVEAGGVLAGEQDPPGSGNGGILLTDRKFGNFELSLDMRPTWGVDSGVFLRCTDRGQCIQMMVDYYDGGSIGYLYGEATGAWNSKTFSLKGELEEGKLVRLSTVDPVDMQTAGLASSCKPEEWLEAWKIDDWNTARIRVEGGAFPHITTNINGLDVCVFDAATARLAKYDRDTVLATLGDAGSVAVQVHGGERYPEGSKCRWRNLRIREL